MKTFLITFAPFLVLFAAAALSFWTAVKDDLISKRG
ncbi:cytochrome bd oxidase small subunit CydS [Aeribacillus sp. FSL M8-0254]